MLDGRAFAEEAMVSGMMMGRADLFRGVEGKAEGIGRMLLEECEVMGSNGVDGCRFGEGERGFGEHSNTEGGNTNKNKKAQESFARAPAAFNNCLNFCFAQ